MAIGPCRPGYGGAKWRKSFKEHAAVNTLGHLLALRVSAANAQDRVHVGVLTCEVQVATG